LLDLDALNLSPIGIRHLIGQLTSADPHHRDRRLRLFAARSVAAAAPDHGRPSERQSASETPAAKLAGHRSCHPAAANERRRCDRMPVRSGQAIYFPQGDVTVLGSVASGSEIVAGGSIHVYGTLRGRAMAGSKGDGTAHLSAAERSRVAGHQRLLPGRQDWDETIVRSDPILA